MKNNDDDNTPADSVETLFKEWHKNPEYVAAYNALEEKYAFYNAMIKAMKEAKVTQKEMAKRMQTSEAAVSRLFDIKGSHTPSWKTIVKFAKALGKRPVLNFVDT